MDVEQRLLALYEAFMRAKYDTAQLKQMLKDGEAFANAKGKPSYPVADTEDLENAILAVGRGKADHAAIRRYLIGRAKALGLEDKIPAGWNADGTLKDEKSVARAATAEDADVTRLIAEATALLQKAKQAQANDPDNTTDPHDAEVWAHLEDSLDAVKEAASDQVKDVAEKKGAEHPHAHPRAGYEPEMYKRQPGENIRCPQCEKYNEDDSNYCDQCGFQLEGAQVAGQEKYEPHAYVRGANDDVWCPNCTKCNAIDAVFCAQCGFRLEGADSVTIGDTKGLQSATDPAVPRSSSPAIPKRAFSSFLERSPAHEVQIELRASADKDANTANFVGYASTTGEPYDVVDWLGEYRERIMPGAFAKTLREAKNIPLLFNHDGWPLASTGSNPATSALSEDHLGLRNEAVLDLLQPSGLEAYRCLKRGTLNKMSFSFRAIKDTWNAQYDDRSVNELACLDTSVVVYPANPGTSAALRSADMRDAARFALGREGTAVMWSVRSAFLDGQRRDQVPAEADGWVDQAIRALFAVDEQLCKQFGPQGRARTYEVAKTLAEVRVGRVLSSGNETLLKQALDALSDASGAITKVIASSATDPAENDGNDNGDTNDEGMDYSADAGGPGSPGGINPLMPQDALGPRIGNTGPRSSRTPDSIQKALAKIAAARGE